jgi:hypothetical protein
MNTKLSSTLKQSMKVAVAALLTAITVWSIFSFWLVFYGWPLDRSSMEYVEDNISPVIASRSREEFAKRVSPELLASLNDVKLREKLYNLSLLGRIVCRTGFRGHATINIGQSVTAKYKADATFENTQAQIEVDLVRKNGAWVFSDLRFTVPVDGEQRTLRFSEANK